MPFLTIPESGLSLGNFPGTASKPAHGVPEVFGLTLNDGVIEEMIKCVQNGKPIQLSLGEHPVSKIHSGPLQEQAMGSAFRSIVACDNAIACY